MRTISMLLIQYDGVAVVTAEQVCRALNARTAGLFRRRRGTREEAYVGEVIRYHQRRNERAARSHRKKRPDCVI